MGYTNAVFTHLPSRTLFIDRYINDKSLSYRLAHELGRLAGREMVLNTSFNVKGQPIVSTPEGALATFLNTGIEFLFLENILVCRRGEK